MSMIQAGFFSGAADLKNVFQSDLLLGANNFMPAGQLFLSVDLRISKQCSHLTNEPAE
jgi:hypothetical protein